MEGFAKRRRAPWPPPVARSPGEVMTAMLDARGDPGGDIFERDVIHLNRRAHGS
jgi:hypothetical protein